MKYKTSDPLRVAFNLVPVCGGFGGPSSSTCRISRHAFVQWAEGSFRARWDVVCLREEKIDGSILKDVLKAKGKLDARTTIGFDWTCWKC